MSDRNRVRLFVSMIAALTVALIILIVQKFRTVEVHERQVVNSPIISPVFEPVVNSTTMNPMKDFMQTPIEFFGIVLDQDNNPVPGANVSASVFDNLVKGSRLSTLSGSDGRFTIRSNGLSLHIEVAKPGYNKIKRGSTLRASSQGFDFGVDNGRGVYKPNAASPTVFQLRGEKNPVQLEELRAQSKIPRDGSLVTLSLANANGIALHIRCNTNENSQIPNAAYDWRCEVSIEGGGIQEVTDEFNYTAPSDGYESTFLIDMPKSLDAKAWSSRANKKLWIQFSDRTYARISFMMNARGDHFATVEGHRNPAVNHRNLESKSNE